MNQLENVDRFYFDDSFQQGIFQLMLNDSDFCYKSIHLLKPEYFNNSYYAYFFKTIKDLYEKLQTSPTPMMIVNEMLRIRNDDRPPYTALFQKIVEPAQVRNFDYIRNSLAHFVKRSKMWQLNKKMVENKFTDPDALFQAAMKDFEELNSVSFQKDEFLTLDGLDRFLEKCASNSHKLMPLGLPSIDKALGGGLPKQTLTTIIGGTNVGKSIALINITHHWLKSGYKVLYINLEGQESQPLLRLMSRHVQADYGRVRFNQLSDGERQKILKMETDYKANFQLKHVVDFGYTVEQLYAYCRDKKQKFAFDGLIVDYGQLLGSKQKTEGMRHTMAYVHRCLASIGVALDVAVVTVAQGTRDIQEKNRKGTDLLRMNDISECFEINRVSAQILTLNRSESDERNERIRILLDKQRDGKKGIIEVCKTNFNTISLYGTNEEGLGFMSTDEYMIAEMDTLSTEQKIDGSKKVDLK